MPRLGALYIVGLLGMLSACAQPTPPVAPPQPAPPAAPLDFDTDPRILRGIWTGTSEDGHTLLINAIPSDPNELGYRVEGTFRLDDREPMVFTGGVQAEVTHPGSVQPQTSPGYSPFVAESPDGLWRLDGTAPAGSPPQFEVLAWHGSEEADSFVMTAPTPTDLAGTGWTLTTLRGDPVLPDTEVTLELDDQHLGGSGGCNGYGASYLASATTLEFVVGVHSTDILCDTPAGVMDQEEAYLEALSRAATYRLEGARLELSDASGTVTLVFSR